MANEVIVASRNQVHVAARLEEMLPRCIFCLYNNDEKTCYLGEFDKRQGGKRVGPGDRIFKRLRA